MVVVQDDHKWFCHQTEQFPKKLNGKKWKVKEVFRREPGQCYFSAAVGLFDSFGHVIKKVCGIAVSFVHLVPDGGNFF
jgi:hypothetical protein